MKKYNVIRDAKGKKEIAFSGTMKECCVYIDERAIYNDEREKWISKDGSELYIEKDKEK